MSKVPVDDIVKLREKGLSYQAIALRLKIKRSTAVHYCLFLGAELPEGPHPSHAKVGKPSRYTYMRNGKLIRGFTPEEDKMLLNLEAQGLIIAEISRKMNRHKRSIGNRLAILARREERALKMTHTVEWTTDQDKIVVDGRKAGDTFIVIAKKLGRTRNSVASRHRNLQPKRPTKIKAIGLR